MGRIRKIAVDFGSGAFPKASFIDPQRTHHLQACCGIRAALVTAKLEEAARASLVQKKAKKITSLFDDLMFVRLLFIVFYLLVVSPVWAADAPVSTIRHGPSRKSCAAWSANNLSVADSPSEWPANARLVPRAIAGGKNSARGQRFFVSKYGEWVLLAPKTQGFSLLVWVLPFVVLIAGVALGLWFIRRWSAKKKEDKGNIANSTS